MVDQLLAILRCPLDPSRTRVILEENHFLCERCRVKFPIKDGVPSFLIEEAQLPAGCSSAAQLPCQKEAVAGPATETHRTQKNQEQRG